MDKKISAYICTGCGIGEALDIEALTGVVTGEMSTECKTHEALCGAAGREMIKGDMDNDGVNTVVIGACSPRVMQDAFDFGDDTITVRANLREQAVWSMEKPTEERGEDVIAEFTQEVASDYMRMGCTQATKTDLPEPYQLEAITKSILVMGGGLSGMTAALEASKAGYAVTLVEKADVLGGKALGCRKQFPTKAPWADLEDNSIAGMVEAVSADSNITVKTSTEVARVSGAPGDFLLLSKLLVQRASGMLRPRLQLMNRI